jgi:lysophospholipase L1-like esterase
MRHGFALFAALFLLPVGCSTAPMTTPSPAPPQATALAAETPGAKPTPRSGAIRYVALGDSYTIGTSVSVPERFPNQLVDRLRGTVDLELVDNLGVNGFTTTDLIGLELPQLQNLDPQFVTLLIGVNDVVQRVSEERYTENVRYILGKLLSDLPPERIVVVSIPDYTRTPRGSDFGQPDIQRAEISRFNEIMEMEATQRGIAFVDISIVADRTGANPALVARDQLHPSGEQYSRWVDFIAPVVEDLLTRTP